MNQTKKVQMVFIVFLVFIIFSVASCGMINDAKTNYDYKKNELTSSSNLKTYQNNESSTIPATLLYLIEAEKAHDIIIHDNSTDGTLFSLYNYENRKGDQGLPQTLGVYWLSNNNYSITTLYSPTTICYFASASLCNTGFVAAVTSDEGQTYDIIRFDNQNRKRITVIRSEQFDNANIPTVCGLKNGYFAVSSALEEKEQFGFIVYNQQDELIATFFEKLPVGIGRYQPDRFIKKEDDTFYYSVRFVEKNMLYYCDSELQVTNLTDEYNGYLGEIDDFEIFCNSSFNTNGDLTKKTIYAKKGHLTQYKLSLSSIDFFGERIVENSKEIIVKNNMNILYCICLEREKGLRISKIDFPSTIGGSFLPFGETSIIYFDPYQKTCQIISI